jgi:hypothetical protein
MLKNLLYDAMTAHVCCKYYLSKALSTGVCNPPSSVIRDYKVCQFGKWLCSSDLPREILNSPHHKSIIKIHIDFHNTAANVMEMIENGEINKAKKMMLDDGLYSVNSKKLRDEFSVWMEKH